MSTTNSAHRRIRGAMSRLRTTRAPDQKSVAVLMCLTFGSQRQVWTDVSDLDLPGLRIESKMDSAVAAKARMPFEQFLRAAVGSENARIAEGRVRPHPLALRSYLCLPGWRGAVEVEPFQG